MFGFGKKQQAGPQVESSVTFSKIKHGEYLMVVKGTVTDESMRSLQAKGAHEIDVVGDITLLIDAREFAKFDCDAAAADMDFFSKYDAHINKIAVLGEAKWEEAFMMLLGAGYRHAEVKYFSPEEEDAARQWLEA
jgi:hypothetical protein